ncbi:IS5 family transposase [Aeromonas sp. FDAARGOS 1405]|uniref:IS5 family transposase n=1 Tax=unclassified Aeromonas TaxID=257493 RepID=UPI001C23C355|nr:IS5 family transposase [Aeromonas sp. FDAARGOS 1405]QXB28396.1 IS5 family transposase [Aeromonas sp. FDAARGOS 1405]
MSRRYPLTDAQWGLIEPLFRCCRISGRPTREPRQVLDGILWILHTGAPWRDLPERFGPWSSVYNIFRRWLSTGRIDAILAALQLHLNEEGLIDFDLWCIDGSNVRASKDAAGARKKNTPVNQALGRSRGGFGSKIHLVTDGNGLPLGFCLSPGQSAEIRYATSALAMARIPTSSGRYRTRPTHLAADKAYSSRALRAELRRRKIKAVIPQRSDQQWHHKGRPLVLDKARYRRRNVVERCFGWLKKFRRFSTRYEKLAGSFAAFIKLAFCLRYLRELLVDRKPAF